MKSGGQKLAFGVRAMTELNEHKVFVCAKVDKENAYNRVLRRRIMRTLVGLPLRFRKYARYRGLFYRPASPVVLAGSVAAFSSDTSCDEISRSYGHRPRKSPRRGFITSK